MLFAVGQLYLADYETDLSWSIPGFQINMKYLKVDLASTQIWCSVVLWQWTVSSSQCCSDCRAWNRPFMCLMHDNEGTAEHHTQLTEWRGIILLRLTVHYQNCMDQSLSWEADSSFTILCPEPVGDSSYPPILFEIHFNAIHPSIPTSSRYIFSRSHSTLKYTN